MEEYPTMDDSGFFCIMYTSDVHVELNELKDRFSDHKVLVRLDSRLNVYLRFREESAMKAFVEEYKHEHTFKIPRATRKPNSENGYDRTYDKSRKSYSTPRNDMPTLVMSEVNEETQPIRATQQSDILLLTKKPMNVEHVIFVNFPEHFSKEDVLNLCTEVDVTPAMIQMQKTKNKQVQYCNIYLRSPADCKVLINTYDGKKSECNKSYHMGVADMIVAGNY